MESSEIHDTVLAKTAWRGLSWQSKNWGPGLCGPKAAQWVTPQPGGGTRRRSCHPAFGLWTSNIPFRVGDRA